MVVRKFASADEADRHDVEYWLSIPAPERLLQVWRLSVDLWRWRGEFRDEPDVLNGQSRARVQDVSSPASRGQPTAFPVLPRQAPVRYEASLARTVDPLRAFVAHDVRFLIVGAYALAVHGRPRATGDLDVWVDATPENARRIVRALAAFGAPMDQVSEADFSSPGVVLQLGVAPGRIDILTALTGLAFEDAWPGRVREVVGELSVDFIGREAFLRNKRATGRPKDLGDIEGLE